MSLGNVKRILRSRQDSNLRGETPLDFKSNALTTRPRLLFRQISFLKSGKMGLLIFKRNSTQIKRLRSRQDSNLRGETPLDFESNALTTLIDFAKYPFWKVEKWDFLIFKRNSTQIK